jgi:hypothetical protein
MGEYISTGSELGTSWSQENRCSWRSSLVKQPPGTHYTGAWVGPRASEDYMQKRKISYTCSYADPLGRQARSLVDIQAELRVRNV